jgi:nucleotide-binding universal stress UspA family protein
MRALIAIDGSDSSFEAIRQAGQILSPDRDTIAFYYSPPTLARRAASEQGVVERGRKALAESVFGQAGSYLPVVWSSAVERIIGTEDPRRGVLEAAEKCSAQLIAVGARGLGFIERVLLGSVSRSVVHAAKVPVLVARQREAPGSTPDFRVLLACENVAAGQQMGKVLNQFTWPTGAIGQVVRVVPNIFAGAVPPWLDIQSRSPDVEQLVKLWVEEHDAEMSTAREEIDALCKQLPAPFRAAPPKVAEGVPEKLILETIGEQGSNLVIVGAKSSTPLGRLLVGSTCESVLNHAPCSVLVIHHPTA